MQNDPEMTKLKAKLEEVKAPENWSEITGPFFHLKLPGLSATGPYLTSSLKNMTQQQCFPEDTLIRDAKNIGEWVNIYAHPTFQRRKPQIVRGGEEEEEEETIPDKNMAYILIDGQKHGPLSAHEIKTLLQQKEILLTDQVSFDDGHSWRKLYEFQDFDRRELEQGQLPDLPGWDIFKNSNTETSNQLEHPDEEQIELNAFAGLAFIENVQAGRSHDQKNEIINTNSNADKLDKDNNTHHTNDIIEQEEIGANIVEFKRKDSIENVISVDQPLETKNWSKNVTYVAAICLMLGASAYMLFDDPMTGVNLLTNRDKANKKLIKRGRPTRGRIPKAKEEMMKRAEKQNKEYAASRINKIRTPPSRMPASITDTDSFQEAREMQERPFLNNQDPYQEYPYDDGSTPVTQDRVRKRLDKQTIDSEGQYYDESQMNEFAGVDSLPNAEKVWGNSEAGRVPAQEDIQDNPEQDLFDDTSSADGY